MIDQLLYERNVPVELLSAIFFHVHGHLAEIIDLEKNLGGLFIAGDIVKRSRIIIPYDITNNTDDIIEYGDGQSNNHEYYIDIKNWNTLMNLFSNEYLKSKIQNIDVAFSKGVFLTCNMQEKLCDAINKLIIEIKDQLTSFRITCNDQKIKYLIDLPPIASVTEFVFRGLLRINDAFEFKSKFPRATTVKALDCIKSFHCLNGYTKIEVLHISVGGEAFPEPNVQNILTANKNYLIDVKLSEMFELNTTQVLSELPNLKRLSVGMVRMYLLSSNSPFPFPPLEFLSINLCHQAIDPYKPVFKCHEVKHLELNLNWIQKHFKSVIQYYQKNTKNLKQITITNAHTMDQMQRISNTIDKVEIIVLENMKLPLKLDVSLSLIVQMLEACHVSSKLEKIIIKGISINLCANLCKVKDKFLTMPKGTPTWNPSPGHVDYVRNVADIIFTRVTKK